MLLKDYVIVLVVISIVTFAITGSIYYINQEYNPGEEVNVEPINKMNKLEKMRESSQSLFNIIQGGGITAGGITGVLFSGIGNFLLLVLSLATLPFEWIISIASVLGIPIEIVTGILILIILGVAFAIVSAILRRTP